MRINQRVLVTIFLTACGPLHAAPASAPGAAPADDESAYAARWDELKASLFSNHELQDGRSLIEIDAPARASDAASVPISLSMKGNRPVKAIYLVIDNNPAPLAAHFTFGPQGDARNLKLRIRVNEYTYIHAVVETLDEQWYSAARFVKASGGCSAPPGGDEQQAMQELGRIELKLADRFVPGAAMQAQLMIHHPNFNGMQMNQLTRMYTPAMFIRTVDINFNGAVVMHIDSDISLASDPVINFGFVPPQAGQLQVLVRDTKGASFGQSFAVPTPAR
jgi:sulfur-oxidizing protein SoxY